MSFRKGRFKTFQPNGATNNVRKGPLVHSRPKLDHNVIPSINANRSYSRIFDIQNDQYREAQHNGKAKYVQPVPLAINSHEVASQQRADQHEYDEHRVDQERGVDLGSLSPRVRHIARDIHHLGDG